MTKDGFAEKLAAKCDLPKTKAMECLDHIFSTKPGEGIIATELQAGQEVAIIGFGSFRTRRSKARKGRNPQTGEEITIEARTAVAFRPGQGLKARVGG